MKCDLDGCGFETEFLPDEAAVERLRIHTNLRHEQKIDISRTDNSGMIPTESKAQFKTVKCHVHYKKNQSFESFEREIEVWKEATKGVADHAKNLMFVEMLGSTENEDVKNFYVSQIMNNETILKTINHLMVKLKDQFGKSQRQKWDEAIKRIGCFQWGEKSP